MPVRYFIASKPTKVYQDQIRDLKQSLSKFKSTINFNDLQQLHLNYKYLGQDLNKYQIEAISGELESSLINDGLCSFKLKLEPLRLGKKFSQSKLLLSQHVQKDTAFKHFTSYLHNIAVRADDAVVRRKDPMNIIGNIKLGQLDRNTSNLDFKAIAGKINQFECAKTLTIEDIEIIKSYLVKNKANYELVKSINLG